MADVLPKEPIVPGERVDVEVIHNFYSFDPSRLEINWDFGDGQIDSGNAELASTSVIYPFGGLYNITCTVKSKFSEIEVNSLKKTNSLKAVVIILFFSLFLPLLK